MAKLRLIGALLLSWGCMTGTPSTVPDGSDELPEPVESFPAECSNCHGGAETPAPPKSISGSMASTEMSVGAHQQHLAVGATTTWHAPIRCASCHQVPTEITSPGHIDDGDNRAEITFGGLAVMGGATPTLESDGSCSNTYCHGATLTGGSLRQPLWTQVDGTQRECGSCHGAPPPAPHPEGSDCGSCHPSMEPGSNDTFLDPSLHINGVVDIRGAEGAGGCDSCHGSGGSSAPPTDLAGNTERTAPGVGAHRVHLGTSPWRREINCSNCHVVPTSVDAPGHMDGDNVAEVPFDGLNPAATVSGSTCSNLYCHGNGRGSNGTALWTEVGTLGCNDCHQTPNVGQPANGMSGAHDKHIRDEDIPCVDCHATVIDGQRTIIGPQLHLDGQHNISIPTGGDYNPGNQRCTNLACHGSESWNDD